MKNHLLRHHPTTPGHSRLGLPGRRGPHPHQAPHQPPSLLSQLGELRAMGASNADLHDVIDQHVVTSAVFEGDPGCGSAEVPIDPLDRCRALVCEMEREVNEFHAIVKEKHVLAAGEFPSKLLEELLLQDVFVTQIHPFTPHGDVPPHFYHLARRGLRGLTNLQDLVPLQFDAVIFHGSKQGETVNVSMLVPVVLRMFQDAQFYLLDDKYPAHYMSVVIADPGFAPLPLQL